ncbi:MAG: glutathione S-transferase family protein [Sphingomonadaceae bacterium]
MSDTLILHEDPRSGNCYKIQLTAALLGLPLERIAYDIMKGETRTPGFLANINANGRIPVLQVNDRFLPESNAACWYLAEGSALVPQDKFERADMLRWMFFEQYNLEPNIATLRFWLHYIGRAHLSEPQQAQIMTKRVAGEDALRIMDDHLSVQPFFMGSALTLADICLFAYTHICEAGGFSLDDHGHICAWIERIKNLPGYTPMDKDD